MTDKPSEKNPNSNPATDVTNVYHPPESAADLVRVLDGYLADLQAGKHPDKAKLLAKHPELADELEQCLAGIEFVHRAGRSAQATPTQIGDFQILREVGRGGMGVVYEAEQISLKRRVALKVLRFGITADPEVLQRFEREATTVAHLHHTNIVPIHVVGCEEGVHYYAMQFIEGKSLAAVADEMQQTPVSGAGRETLTNVVGWMLQAAEALAYAHHRGVVHRDVKPSNLILDPEGTVWLTDFGLAKRADEVTMTAAGILMGTPRYMSPEQASAANQPIDHRTDIYSLGATLYELVTGNPVFDGKTPQGVITQILSTEPVAPHMLCKSLPRDLETIILKCLAKAPESRYQSARDLADDLRAFTEHRPIRARRASMAERTKRWIKKHRQSTLAAIVTSIASVLLVAGLIFGRGVYNESQMGRVMLTTQGPSLVAEVLDDNDQRVLPSFPVPTSQPVKLPHGNYHLRVSGSRTISETIEFNVAKGAVSEIPILLSDRSIGPAIEYKGPDEPLPVVLNGQTHLLHRTDQGWRLLSGSTWAPAWPQDLRKFPEKPEEAPYPNTAAWGAWHDLLQVTDFYQSESTGTAPGIAQSPVDVDGDGSDDLIFGSRVSPSLVAVSGKDGRVLWWYRALPLIPAEHDNVADPIDLKGSAEAAGTLSVPVITQIGGESVALTVCVSMSHHLRSKSGKDYTRGPRAFYVDAVSLRTGRQLWRSIFDLPDLLTSSSREISAACPSPPAVATIKNQPAILLQAGSRLFAFDLITGKQLASPMDLPARPAQAAEFRDFDGDGSTDTMVVCRPELNSRAVTIRVVSPVAQKELWSYSFMTEDQPNQNETLRAGCELAWGVDFDGNGIADVLAPDRDDWEKFGDHTFGIQLLDGSTGEPRWKCNLWSSPTPFANSGTGPNFRCLAGPDLNGDGTAELFVSSLVREFNDARSYLQVDAVSGKEGKILWHREIEEGALTSGFRARRSLLMWQPDTDGRPELVYPIEVGSNDQPLTYILSSATGRTLHVLSEIADVRAADMDSDGIQDLACITDDRGAKRFQVIRGLPPLEWHRPAPVIAGDDFDKDGTMDYLETGKGIQGTTAQSGADGHALWHADSRNYLGSPTITLDLDKDGIKDFVAFDDSVSNGSGDLTLSAFSGENGHPLWQSSGAKLTNGNISSSGGGLRSEYRYPLLASHDFDRDGRPEVVVAQGGSNSLQLTALSAADGHSLWNIPFAEAGFTGESVIDRHIYGDLNSDKVDDVVLWTRATIEAGQTQAGYVLQASSGRDGTSIWKSTFTVRWFLWPRPVIGDLDGDGNSEVVVTTNDGQGNSNRGNGCELLVLHGRDGTVKWRWPFVASDLRVLPPLLINANGTGQRVLCMGVPSNRPDGNLEFAIHVFGPDGSVTSTIPVGTSWTSDRRWSAVHALGDGREQLICGSDNEICLYGLDSQKPIWIWKTDASRYTLETVRDGVNGSAGLLTFRRGQALIGVNADTGTIRWRCDVPSPSGTQSETLAMVEDQKTADSMPVVLSHFSVAGRPQTTAQHANSTDAAGHYAMPVAAPLTAIAYQSPVRYRSLPWTRGLRFGSTELMMLLIFLVVNIYSAARCRWRLLGAFLIAWIAISASIAIVILALTNGSKSENRMPYSWDGWYFVFVIGAAFFGLLAGIVLIPRYAFLGIRRMWPRSSRPAATLSTDKTQQ